MGFLILKLTDSFSELGNESEVSRNVLSVVLFGIYVIGGPKEGHILEMREDLVVRLVFGSSVRVKSQTVHE